MPPYSVRHITICLPNRALATELFTSARSADAFAILSACRELVSVIVFVSEFVSTFLDRHVRRFGIDQDPKTRDLDLSLPRRPWTTIHASMRILLTNDDGIRAPGILAMYHALAERNDVCLVAPETVQSASGHGITLNTPLLTSEVDVAAGVRGIAVDGRPADCVKLAISQLLPWRPDLVVSGINSGANVGINVLYSGTVAAAIEAAFLGVPALATSLLLKREVEPDYDAAALITLGVIEELLAGGFSSGGVASVNVPALRPGESTRGIKYCRQCTRPWLDTYDRRTDPRGKPYFWNSSIFKLSTSDLDTDVAYLRDGYTTVTPLQFDLTAHQSLAILQGRHSASNA